MIPTAAEVRNILSYDPDTGDWTRTVTAGRHGCWKAGTKAGTIAGNGYAQLSIGGKRYWSHRVAWLYMTGEWPPDFIDHIDGNPLNNRWANLRKATAAQNLANSKLRCTNTSGHRGIRLRDGKWQARITIDNRELSLGLFAEKEDAIAAYRDAATKARGEFLRMEAL